ncbi:hypothetical protein TYRP_014609 [Tyrophagus putrescentiae]|nr:hypothetical protein TYRP_014609 [Tyrophagus putrescentiae]
MSAHIFASINASHRHPRPPVAH